MALYRAEGSNHPEIVRYQVHNEIFERPQRGHTGLIHVGWINPLEQGFPLPMLFLQPGKKLRFVHEGGPFGTVRASCVPHRIGDRWQAAREQVRQPAQTLRQQRGRLRTPGCSILRGIEVGLIGSEQPLRVTP